MKNKLLDIFFKLNIFKKLRVTVIISSQLNVSTVEFRHVLKAHETTDFSGLHKNKNCTFPIRKTRKNLKLSK